MLKAAVLTLQLKDPKHWNKPLSIATFLQVPHHTDTYMKPIKLQVTSEMKNGLETL